MREESLAGKCIVVTRARQQASTFGDALRAAGARVIYCAAIRIADPVDPEPFRSSVRRVHEFDWIVLTSVNGVARFFDEMQRASVGFAALKSARFAAVGPATAAAIESHGFIVDVMPSEFTGAALPGAMRDVLRPGARVLIPRAAGGNAALPAGLLEAGAHVTDVESYCSVPDLEDIERVRDALDRQEVDLLTFTSPSAVSYFVDLVQRPLNSVPIAAIGPITASRAVEAGLHVAIQAEEYSIPGLVAAIVVWFDERRTELI